MNGSYGHNGGRQQRKRPRDFDDDQYRRPRTFDILDKLRRDLVNLADPGTVNPLDDIKYVARRFAIDFESPENQTRMLELLKDCILQLSVKTCHYAATVCLAAGQNRDFGSQVVEMISSNLSRALEKKEWRDAKLLLRFIAGIDLCLSTEGSTASSILKEMTSKLTNVGLTARNEDADHICYIILITLPYLSAALAGNPSETRPDFAEPLEQIGQYMALRTVDDSDINRHYSRDFSHKQSECLELLYRQCLNAKSLGWQIAYVPNLLSDLGQDLKISALAMPQVAIPEIDLASVSNSRLSFYLQIFADQSVESVPSVDHLASSVFRDLTSDILDLLVANRKECARFLIDLESYLPPKLFVLRGTPLDKIDPEGPKWKAEDIVVEGIFAKLFSLPNSLHKPVYYHSVLTELCKLVPQAIAPTFGRAIRAVYQNLEHLEPEVIYRFWDWFSHHLSNFGFNWKWQEWIGDLELDKLHPKSVFIRETIAKEAELSYNQRIKTTLPSEYHDLILDEAPGPNFAYISPDNPFSEATNNLMSLLSTGAEAAQIEEVLSSMTEKAAEAGLDKNHETIMILVQSILQLGHQSFSHALNTIEHNLPLLQARCDASPEGRRSTVAAVMQFWSGRPLIASTLLQKFLNYRIISPLSILEYLFQQDDAIVSRSVAWELVKTTIDKVNARVGQVQERLAIEMEKAKEDEQLQNLQMTWQDVQRDQKEVLAFTITHFTEALQASGGDLWVPFWTRGLFNEILRRYRTVILTLKDDFGIQDQNVLRVLE